MPDDLKDSILSIFEASLDAQLRAVRRLRGGSRSPAPRRRAQVCPKLTWLSTYSKRPAPPCTSPNSWPASTPPSTSPSIAKAWSLRSPRKSPAAIVSCAPARTLSAYVRRSDDSLRRLVGDRGGLGAQFPPAAHPAARRAPSPGLAWSAWAGAVCRASSGRRAASSAVGRASTFSTRVVAGNRRRLFAGVWRRALPYCPGRLVGVAVDDTRLRKTGRAIPQARYHRDPLSPSLSCQPHARLALSASFSAAAPAPARATPVVALCPCALKRRRR